MMEEPLIDSEIQHDTERRPLGIDSHNPLILQ